VSISTTSGLHIHHTKLPVGTLLQSALLAARHVYKELVLFFFSFSSSAAQVSFLRKLLSKAVHRRSQVLRIFFSRSSKLREERKKPILEYCGPQIISL
jgi:hypothetical protein